MTEDEARTEFVNIFVPMFLANWAALHYDTLSRRFGSGAGLELAGRAPVRHAKVVAELLYDKVVDQL